MPALCPGATRCRARASSKWRLPETALDVLNCRNFRPRSGVDRKELIMLIVTTFTGDSAAKP